MFELDGTTFAGSNDTDVLGARDAAGVRYIVKVQRDDEHFDQIRLKVRLVFVFSPHSESNWQTSDFS